MTFAWQSVVSVLKKYVWKLHTLYFLYFFMTLIFFLWSKLQSSIENSSIYEEKIFESFFEKEKKSSRVCC